MIHFSMFFFSILRLQINLANCQICPQCQLIYDLVKEAKRASICDRHFEHLLTYIIYIGLIGLVHLSRRSRFLCLAWCNDESWWPFLRRNISNAQANCMPFVMWMIGAKTNASKMDEQRTVGFFRGLCRSCWTETRSNKRKAFDIHAVEVCFVTICSIFT